MPPFIRAVAMLFIGVPGGLLWLVGMVAFVLSCGAFFSPHSDGLGASFSMAASLVSSTVGFAMVACTEMLNGAKRYRMPRTRLPAYLGLELLQGLLAVATVAITLAAFDSFADEEFGPGALWTAFEAVIIFLLVANHRAIRSKGSVWRAELTS